MAEFDRDTGAATWPHELYDLLRRAGVTQFAYVPDAGHKVLIDRSLADPDAHSIPLTTEEEGVALLAGADLGGARFPFLTFVSMRGEHGEGNPWQFPMGQAVAKVLEAMGVICLRAERADEVIPTASAALTMAFQSGQAVAVLLTQKLIGAKSF